MIIRKGTKDDLMTMALLWEDMVKEVNPEYAPNVQWWIDDTLDLMEHDETYMLYVAEGEEGVIGFTDGFMYAEPAQGKIVGWSRHTYTVPGYRRTSASGRLLRAIHAEARERGAQIAMFSCVDALVPFWRKHGYKPMETVMEGEV